MSDSGEEKIVMLIDLKLFSQILADHITVLCEDMIKELCSRTSFYVQQSLNKSAIKSGKMSSEEFNASTMSVKEFNKEEAH